ncbi:MAG: M23 family metallopeptidase [Bacilli bacterium]|nr:M23 family metallopeptidase [Bacilli bacterium]
MKNIITDESIDLLILQLIKGDDYMYPIKTKKLVMTSGYGKRTYTLNGKKVSDFHHGIDLVGGTDILATADGVVTKTVKVGKKGGTMCQIRIRHKDYETAYYHLKSGSIKVNVGDTVKQGQVIAEMGDTGKVTGKHLHYQIDRGSNLTSIDPYDYVFNDKVITGITTGLYKVSARAMAIRSGAGTEYRIKKIKEVSTYAKNHATSQKATADTFLKVGTEVDILELKNGKNNSIWGRTYSGWICLYSHLFKEYCKRI